MSDSSAELRARLEFLPQELYDHVWELTFTAEPGMRDVDTKPGRAAHRGHLKLLQIDSASRAHYAASYYGAGASFRFIMGSRFSWLNSLSIAHSSLLRDIVCVWFIKGYSEEDESVLSMTAGTYVKVLTQQRIERNAWAHRGAGQYLRLQCLRVYQQKDIQNVYADAKDRVSYHSSKIIETC